jgi:hypothetical protein
MSFDATVSAALLLRQIAIGSLLYYLDFHCLFLIAAIRGFRRIVL